MFLMVIVFGLLLFGINMDIKSERYEKARVRKAVEDNKRILEQLRGTNTSIR